MPVFKARARKPIERPAKRALPASLPRMREVKSQTRSKVAATFFSSRHYARKGQYFIGLFNKNPQEFFNKWQGNLRSFLLEVRKLEGKQRLNRQEMLRLADSFFAEYCPNALSESVQGVRGIDSGIYPSLYMGIYELMGKGQSKIEAQREFLTPLASELFLNAGNPKLFNAKIQQVLAGETTTHGKVRLLRGPKIAGAGGWHGDYEMPFGRYQSIQRQKYERLLEESGRKKASEIRTHELLGRQLAVVNEVHAATAVYAAPRIGALCDKFIAENNLQGIDAGLWPLAKLARIAVRLRP